MLPWINPTVIGSPEFKVFEASRRPPHSDTITSSPTVRVAAIVRRVPDVIAATATPALSVATNHDNPSTPVTLASCATGNSVIIVLPSGIHGKPPSTSVPRIHSIDTHTAGASHRPAHWKRRIRSDVIAPNTAT